MKHPFVEYLVERDLIPPNVARQLTEHKRFVREPIGMIAVSHGLLRTDDIDIILDRQREFPDRRFGEIAVELGCLTPQQVDTLVKIQEFRAPADIAEALALGGVLSVEDAGRYFGTYLVRDQEMAAMMADEQGLRPKDAQAMNGTLLDKIKKTARLPSPPGMALQILQLCQSQDVSIGQLADTLAADPALSLRLLKYANSALVGASKEVTNVRDAVLLLGIRSVRMMALSFSLVSNDDTQACRGFEYERFWAHSLACAACARHLAARNKPLPPEEAFAAGLLSHIGKLVFAVGMPNDYPAVLQTAGGTLGRTEKDESAYLGSSHHELGADLLTEWGIPHRLSEAVRHQRMPDKLDGDADLRTLCTIVATATDMADLLCEAGPEVVLASRRQKLVSSPLFHGEDDLAGALEITRREFGDLAAILSVSEGSKRSAAEIQAEAGTVLTELSLAAQLQTEAIAKENEGLQKKAWTDGLTGIPNRAAFDDRLARVWTDACQKGSSIALIILDIDHFKKFNDTYGHLTGDAVLKRVAACLAPCVRSVDMVARYGGEEFVAILPNADRMTAAHVSVKIRKAIESCVVELDGCSHRVTVSVGTVLLPRAGKPFTAQMLIDAADKQLYCAKEKGRNCCSMKQLQAEPDHAASLAHV